MEDPLKLVHLGIAKPSYLHPSQMLRVLHAHLGDALFDIAKGLSNDGAQHE